ncbi:MAG: Lrp/AsnC family transcriptional regulator [Alphaproteobacteria bacterium]
MKILDTIDQKILALLQDNARRSVIDLAKRIGLSRSATQERLTRLESSGVIEQYTIRTASHSKTTTRGLLAITLKLGMTCPSLARRLQDFPEVKSCYTVAGAVDIILLVESPNSQALGILRERIATLPEIATIETTLILATHISRS